MIDSFLQNVRIAVRSLLRSPALLMVASLSLALGIGVNTTIFSAVDVFLIRPLPYPDEDRILQVWGTNRERGANHTSTSPADYHDWRERSRTIELAAYRGASFNLRGTEQPERVVATRVSSNFFRVLGISPALGRAFTDDEEAAGRDQVVIVSHAFWQTQLAGNPRVVGETLILNGAPHTVVGVMPRTFEFGSSEVQMWAPLGVKPDEARDARSLQVIGRLRGEATESVAAAELEQIAKQLEQTFPATNRGMGARVIKLRDEMFNEYFRAASMICTVAVGFVLLIACANVANLMLVRAGAREREIAVRTALGAGRQRIAAQLLIESLVLAVIGGALGLVFSIWGIRALVGMMPPWFLLLSEIRLSPRVLLYTAGITLGSGVLFGLAPALRASRPDLTSTLRDGTRNATIGTRRGRLRNTLVVAEIALALVLMISAGLLVKSSIALQTVPLGLRLDSLLMMRVALPESDYPDSARVAAFYEAAVARVRAIPGVAGASAGRCIPMTCGIGRPYTVAGRPEAEKDRRPVTQVRSALPDYFQTVGIELRRGRLLTAEDRRDSRAVAVINETLARKHWESGNPIGEQLVFDDGPREIVGVVSDVREWGPDEAAPPMIYVPHAQESDRAMAIFLRTGVPTETIVREVRGAIAGLDANLPVSDFQTREQLLENVMGGDLVLTRLLAFFAVAALVLAVIGVYGVMAYSVSQRTAEMGIRMAIGAQRADILRLVVRQGSTIAGLGLGIGLLGALLATRGLSLFLHGVSAFDLLTFAGVSLTLGLAALLASYLPALRATRVDPLIALRYE